MTLELSTHNADIHDNYSKTSFDFNLNKNLIEELDSKCVEFLERKRIEISTEVFPQFNSFWNPSNFVHYNTCDTPSKVYNEISYNLSSGTSLNNQSLGLFISQIGNVISTTSTTDLFNSNYQQHKQLTSLFHNEELASTKQVEEAYYIFQSIRLLFEIYHLSPDEYIKSISKLQITKNQEIIHLIFTFAARLPQFSYAASRFNNILSLVESDTVPKIGPLQDSVGDNVLGAPQNWDGDSNHQNFFIKIVSESLGSNQIKNRIFGLNLSSIAPILTASNGNLLYLLKFNLYQKLDKISQFNVSEALIETLNRVTPFFPEYVTIHFTSILYPKHNIFSADDYIEHIRFMGYCSSIPEIMVNCREIAYTLCWKCIERLNENISAVTSTDICFMIIELLCQYYELSTKLIYDDSTTLKQCTELITLCMQISQEPFNEMTNKIHCSVFKSLLNLHESNKISTSILYQILINFGNNLTGNEVIEKAKELTLTFDGCSWFLHNKQFRVFVKSNMLQIAYIILKLCFDCISYIYKIDNSHISYQGVNKDETSSNLLSYTLKQSNVSDFIQIAAHIIMFLADKITIVKFDVVNSILSYISKIYYIHLKKSIKEFPNKLLIKQLIFSIVNLFKQLMLLDSFDSPLLLRYFKKLVEASLLTRYSKKYFETALLNNSTIISQIYHYTCLQYFDSFNTPLPTFTNSPLQIPAFESVTLNLSIFKAYFIGIPDKVKIVKYESYAFESIEEYHSCQDILKKHIVKLVPAVVKFDKRDINRINYIYALGCLSSGLNDLAHNYFNQILYRLTSKETFDWVRVLIELSANNLSNALNILTSMHDTQLNAIDEKVKKELWTDRINYFIPEPILITWLHPVLLLNKMYRDFLTILNNKSIDTNAIKSLVFSTKGIVISLKLINNMLSTKSLYSRLAGRLYVAKAKLLLYLLSYVYPEGIDSEIDDSFMSNLSEGINIAYNMLDSTQIDKLLANLTFDTNSWNSKPLSVSWAMEFGKRTKNDFLNSNERRQFDKRKTTYICPTSYFKAVSDIFTRNAGSQPINNSTAANIGNIIKEINEVVFPIPLVMLSPKNLIYIPLSCKVEKKEGLAMVFTLHGELDTDSCKRLDIFKVEFVRIRAKFDTNKRSANDNTLLYDVNVKHLIKKNRIRRIEDIRVIESMPGELVMYSIPLNHDKLPIGQPTKVLIY